jgi:hypothetical protein
MIFLIILPGLPLSLTSRALSLINLFNDPASTLNKRRFSQSGLVYAPRIPSLSHPPLPLLKYESWKEALCSAATR